MARKKMTEEEKAARAEARREARRLAEIAAEKNQPIVNQMTINIEWKRSRTWGTNPAATCEGSYHDDTAGPYKTGYFRDETPARASGCGYDKESTVVAELCNRHLKGNLYAADMEKHPYGVYEYNGRRSFSEGIGMSCYYRIAEWLGGTLEHVASGKTFDVYRFTFGG